MSRVLVIDDHPIVLQGVKQLLENAGVNQIYQARSLADGFRLYRTQKPNVIIVDLTIGTGALSGLSFIRRLRLLDQQTPILVLTMHSDPVIVSRALEVGATGYVLKDTSSMKSWKPFRGCARTGLISAMTLLPRSPSWRRGGRPILCGG